LGNAVLNFEVGIIGEKMKLFGIKHSKYGPLGLYVDPNDVDSDFCNPTRVALTQADDEHPLYLVRDVELVKEVINNPPEWYNSSCRKPEHKFKKSLLSIFEVDFTDSIG